MITQSINLNLIPGAVPPRIKISQYDQGSRTLTFTLYNGTTAFTTSGVTAKIQGTKPDMKGFAYDASYSSGVVTANLTRQMSCVAGDVLCELVLYKNGEVLGTGNFVLDVEASALADDVDTSETVLPAYIDAAERAAADAATSAVNAAASATSASGSASSASASANSANTAKTAAETAQAAAEAAAAVATAAELNPPYIGANGNWYVYDTVLEEYKDSGIDASITTNIADITMLEPDAAPYVTNTGTSTDTNFHFYIPRGLKGDTGNTGAKGDTGDTGAKGDKGDKGETGTGIASIEKTGTSGLVDTYTITYTDGTTQEYTVTNGASATLPAGGTTGQALVKLSSADSDAGWRDVDIPVATAQTAGKVKPDGETITIDNDGTIHGPDTVPVAAVGRLGKVKPDGTSIIIDADGTIHAKGGGGVPVGDVSGAAVSIVNETATFTWSDPADVIIDGTTIAAWAGTKLVRKLGSAPADEDDGTVILDNTVRNAYATTGFTDSDIEYDTTYYYRFFPYTDRDVVTKGTGISVTPERTIIPLPSQDGAVTYNGSQQTAQFADYDSNKMEVTGNTGTNAGSYTAQFTPKHDYMWSDGTRTSKAVSWIISKKPLSVPSVSGSYTYDTTQKSAVIGAYDVNEITQSGDSTGTNAGTYNVLFDLVDSSNMEWSDGTTGQKSGSWVIAKAAGGCTLSKNTATLDADNLTDTVTVTAATGTVSGASSSDTSIATVSVSGNDITVSHVNKATGTATVTVNIAASANYNATSVTFEVEATFTTVYGAEWDGTSTTAWSRTDAAAGFVDPVPAVNNGNGSSPFDNLMPWAGMEIVDDATAGKLVKIPKYWYKWTRNGSRMKLQIADGEQDGFLVSPAHADRGDGAGERDYVYVGRYHCATSTYKSTTGVKPANNYTRANFRSYIHNLGTDIWQYDFAMYWTIMMLYLVEFADWNSQAKIGYGCGNSSAAENAGLTDAMQYHTGTNAANRTTYGHTQYRHIEDLWGNVYDWCDGIYFSGSSVYCIKNPADFSDGSGGTMVGTRSTSSNYISAWTAPSANGFEYALYPSAVNGSESTYVCDYCYYDSSGVVLCVGGGYFQNQGYGAYYLYGDNAASYKSSYIGSRLQKLPSAA